MNILLVDDEVPAIESMKMKIGKCISNGEITAFTSPSKALEWLKNVETKPDVALLDINMGQISGLQLASEVKVACPQCSIVFVTGYAEYAIEAFSLKANGYLVKPVDLDDLKRELDWVRNRNSQVGENLSDDKVHVQCFGNFEVTYQGQSVAFKRSKSKEVFAYLIDRKGSSATMAEIASIIWEDGIFDTSRNNQIHTFIHDLMEAFKQIGKKDIIEKHRNAIRVRPEHVECDFYNYMKGYPEAINAYTGEYMSQYSWAEITAGKLLMELEK